MVGGGGVDDVAKNKERRTVSKTMSLFTVEEHLRIVVATRGAELLHAYFSSDGVQNRRSDV